MCTSLRVSVGSENGLVWSQRFEQYTLFIFRRNVETKPALFRANTLASEIYTWFYPQVYYLFIVLSYFSTPCKASNNTYCKTIDFNSLMCDDVIFLCHMSYHLLI